MPSHSIQIGTVVPLFVIIAIQLSLIIRESNLLEEVRGHEITPPFSEYSTNIRDRVTIPALERYHLIHVMNIAILGQALYTVERNVNGSDVFILSLPISIIWCLLPILEFDEYHTIMKFEDDVPDSLLIHALGTLFAVLVFFLIPYSAIYASIFQSIIIIVTTIAFFGKIYIELVQACLKMRLEDLV